MQYLGTVESPVFQKTKKLYLELLVLERPPLVSARDHS